MEDGAGKEGSGREVCRRGKQWRNREGELGKEGGRSVERKAAQRSGDGATVQRRQRRLGDGGVAKKDRRRGVATAAITATTAVMAAAGQWRAAEAARWRAAETTAMSSWLGQGVAVVAVAATTRQRRRLDFFPCLP